MAGCVKNEFFLENGTVGRQNGDSDFIVPFFKMPPRCRQDAAKMPTVIL